MDLRVKAVSVESWVFTFLARECDAHEQEELLALFHRWEQSTSSDVLAESQPIGEPADGRYLLRSIPFGRSCIALFEFDAVRREVRFFRCDRSGTERQPKDE